VRCSVHSAEGYLLTLIRKGFRVAVLRTGWRTPQKPRSAAQKSVVKTRMSCDVTPGTLPRRISLLEARRNNFTSAPIRLCGIAALAMGWILNRECHVNAPCAGSGLALNWRVSWTFRSRCIQSTGKTN